MIIVLVGLKKGEPDCFRKKFYTESKTKFYSTYQTSRLCNSEYSAAAAYTYSTLISLLPRICVATFSTKNSLFIDAKYL